MGKRSSDSAGLTNSFKARRAHGLGLAVLLGALTAWVASGISEVRADDLAPKIAPVIKSALGRDTRSGTLKFLTYNVAGLPSVISGSDPEVNTGQVSPLLNRYDVVVAQEDFSYHAELVESAEHRYLAFPSYPRSTLFGDGLAVLSKFPIRADARVRWRECNGYLLALSDCFAEKGFSSLELRLTPKVQIPVINLHADAGESAGDVEARQVGFEQLASYVAERFAGSALIVAGDTNLDDRDPRDVQILTTFLKRTGLREVCREFQCTGQNLDRILYRSSRQLTLEPLAWKPDARFVDQNGEALSDHPAMAAEFRWQVGGP